MTKPAYGGQAVIEGVMMRGQKEMAVAVRNPAGQIVVHSETLTGFVYTSRWAKLPFLRGIVMLWDTLALGMRTLLYSVNVAASEEEVEMPAQAMWGTMVVALAFAVGLFFVLPVLLAAAVGNLVDPQESQFVSLLVEKVIRIVILVGYIAAVGFFPDIKRVFAYHGAEHKSINAYEAGEPLEVDIVTRYSTAHPRCGTSFLLVVVVVSFFFFLFIPTDTLEWRVVSRIVLIPLIAGVAYEFIKFAGAHYSHPIMKILLAPGMGLQSLTTREPTPDQVEVALAALKRVLAADQEPVASQAEAVAGEMPA